jgi:hypothetical protein
MNVFFYNNIPSKLVTILAKLKSIAMLYIDSGLFVPVAMPAL